MLNLYKSELSQELQKIGQAMYKDQGGPSASSGQDQQPPAGESPSGEENK